MKPCAPPTLAHWLLDRLRYLRNNPALAGDLQEEFESGRSSRWYWHQTLTIIARGMRQNLADYWDLVAVILTGMAAGLGVAILTWRFWIPFAKISLLPAVASLAFVWLASLNFKSIHGAKWQAAVTVRWIAMNITLPLMILWGNFLNTRIVEACWWAAMLAVVLWLLAVSPSPKRSIPVLYQTSDLSLQVELSDGRVIFLRPENIIEQVFAAGDEALAAALFGGSATIEVLRRAIWLGSVGRPQPVSLRDLSALVNEAAATGHVERAFVVE